MESDQLLENVGNLLSLLERVEQGILDDSSSLNSQVGTRLAKRLRQLADLVDKECNAVEILDDYSDQTQESSAQQQLSEEDTDSMESTDTEVQVKGERRAPTPPNVASPQQPHLQERPPMSQWFSDSQPKPLDAIDRKRRREAEEMVKKLNKRQTHSCGLSYTGDKTEKEFSDGIKEDLKHKLPALKGHREIFHYMAWATTERLECDHCRQCPNTYQ